MKNKSIKFISLPIIFGAFLIFLPTNVFAQNTFYNFRSTVVGSGVKQTGQYVYEIANEKVNFSTDESVFFLTRIFNITNVDRFQFKHEIRSGSFSKEVLSPVYYPHRNWWAEIYYWDELGKLPTGNYEVKSFVSVDGGSFAYHRTTNFAVSHAYDQSPEYGYRYYYSDPAINPEVLPISYYPPYFSDYRNYNYSVTEIGHGVRSTGQYSYEIIDKNERFRRDQDVYALAKIMNISGVNSFQIKFDIYLNGNTYTRSHEVGALYPGGQKWDFNHSWANLGKLPAGNHQIRTFIRIDGKNYVLLGTRQIFVEEAPYVHPEKRDCYYRYHDCRPGYRSDWTKMNDTVYFRGGYDYEVPFDKTEYYENEPVKVLTKISDIRGVRDFKIKHALYRGSSYLREIESPLKRPDYNYWYYNYTQSDFGRLDSGNYSVLTYISVNGGTYSLLDTKYFTVKKDRVGTVCPRVRIGDYYYHDYTCLY